LACCSFASTVAAAPSTPVWMTARISANLAASTQPVATVAAACDTGSSVASTAMFSEAREFGNMVLSFRGVG
jgi:hypothetical protein